MTNIVPYGHMIQEYYVDKVRKLTVVRKDERARIKTKSQALRLVSSVRKKIFRCFGPFPDRTSLDPKVVGKLERRGYTVEKVIIHSRPDFPVTTNIYIPKKQGGRLPAVLGTCGHANDGKAGDLYQRFAQGLALQGYIVLMYDPISQGERCQYLKEKGALVPRGCCQEHNMMGNQMHLVGEFFGMWRVWDGIRCLDYLLSRTDVDRTRVGVTGNSGGGTLSTYLNALDSRFTMAAPSCFVTTCLHNLENELPQDTEQMPPHLLEYGCDMADYFIARAPRPILLMGQENDYFDPRGTLETFSEVRRIYGLLGASDNAKVFIGPNDHGYFTKNREAMYEFFNTHARVKKSGHEPRVKPETPDALNCTRQGQAYLSPYKRVFDFTKDKALALAGARRRFRKRDFEKLVASMLKVKPVKMAPYYRILRPEWDTEHKTIFNRFAVETEPGIQGILYLISSRGIFHIPRGRASTLYVPHLSSKDDIKNGLHKAVTKNGGNIFCFDPRGVGESLPLTCSMDDFFVPYGSDFFYAAHGIMLGEPCLGRKVHDVLSAVALLRRHGYTDIHLIGRGLGAITCAFAGIISHDISRVTLINILLSYHELTQTALFRWPLSYMVGGILKNMDLPDVYNALAGKGLRILDPWDEKMKIRKLSKCRKHAKELGKKRRREV